MSEITNPIAIKFVNEKIRPITEKIRALVAAGTSIKIGWDSGIKDLFPNDDSLVADGREAEGVSRVTGADINNVMIVAEAMLSQNNPVVIEKPTVRALEAN